MRLISKTWRYVCCKDILYTVAPAIHAAHPEHQVPNELFMSWRKFSSHGHYNRPEISAPALLRYCRSIDFNTQSNNFCIFHGNLSHTYSSDPRWPRASVDEYTMKPFHNTVSYNTTQQHSDTWRCWNGTNFYVYFYIFINIWREGEKS